MYHDSLMTVYVIMLSCIVSRAAMSPACRGDELLIEAMESADIERWIETIKPTSRHSRGTGLRKFYRNVAKVTGLADPFEDMSDEWRCSRGPSCGRGIPAASAGI